MNARTPRLREADGNGLTAALGAALAAFHFVHLFPDILTRLC